LFFFGTNEKNSFRIETRTEKPQSWRSATMCSKP
jgi:hypothetical protein